MEQQPLDISLTTPMRLAAGTWSADIEDIGGPQPRLTLAYLVLNRAKPVQHEALADVLWPEGPPPTWHAALRTLVSQVRKFLNSVQGVDARLTGGEGYYWLQLPESTTVDVEEARRAALVAEQHLEDRDLAKKEALTALEITERAFLPGTASPWVTERRARLKKTRLRALQVIARIHLAAGDADRAVRAARDAIDLAPLREENIRLLMRALTANGERAEALRVFERCREQLAEELGADPSPATARLHLQLLGGSGRRSTG